VHSDDFDFFDEMRRVEGLIARQHGFLSRPREADHPEPPASRLVSVGFERIEARQRFLARSEALQLARTVISIVALAGIAVAIWILALHGDPNAVLRIVGI
jgi:hypothetical protein